MANKTTTEASNPPSQATPCGSYPATVCSASVFQQEYLGMFPQESARDRWLIDLAKEYHTRTEAYDRSICTGPILHGGIIPETPHQHRAIHRNATAVHRELFETARQLGYTGVEWRKALHSALREIERQNPAVRGRESASVPCTVVVLPPDSEMKG